MSGVEPKGEIKGGDKFRVVLNGLNKAYLCKKAKWIKSHPLNKMIICVTGRLFGVVRFTPGLDGQEKNLVADEIFKDLVNRGIFVKIDQPQLSEPKTTSSCEHKNRIPYWGGHTLGEPQGWDCGDCGAKLE